MRNNARLYDLSFVSSSKKRGEVPTRPQLVFSINDEHLVEVNRRLSLLVERNKSNAALYFRNKECSFSFPEDSAYPDLFGRMGFGYEKCGFFTRGNAEVKFHIELQGGVELLHAVLTLSLLVCALGLPIADGERRSNRVQQLDLETGCDPKASGYGHAVAGWASFQLTSWIQKKTAMLPEGQHSMLVPEEIINAMRDAWQAIVEEDHKEWASDCRGFLTKDGRFILECFGDACDIAIYPDSPSGGEEYGTMFSCHNLDRASQQITLLAGLAKLCELARSDQ